MEMKGRVNSILEKLSIKEPPVPIEAVAKFFGIHIISYPKFPDSISGTIIKDDDLHAIGVNENHPRVRQRFTIAHELGHYIMGHDTNKILDDTFDKNSDQEKEANKFAGEILMPLKILKDDIEKQVYDIPTLAKRYEVSEQAMSVRLIETHLIYNQNLKKPAF
jgi:Zn-dependent peptidase ImmA (M78 family)